MSKKKKSRSGLRLNVVTSCISTTLVLVLLGAVVFFVTTATHLSDMLRENFTVSVMLDDDIPNNEANKLQQQLRRLPCAASVSYISKERAAAEQIKAMGCDPSEFLGSNPIPASFEIHLKADYTTSDSLETIIPGLKEQKYVMDVDYPKELMESINSNIRKISIILLAVALLLTFVSFVLINNTMRLSIYARRFSHRLARALRPLDGKSGDVGNSSHNNGHGIRLRHNTDTPVRLLLGKQIPAHEGRRHLPRIT